MSSASCLLLLVRGQLQQPILTQLRGSLACLGVVGEREQRSSHPVWRQLRRFSSQSPTKDARKQLDCTKSILQQANILQLRESLDDESERSLHIPYAKFLKMIRASGAAHDEDEAEEVGHALHRSGIVLRHEDTVYLKPEEIVEKVVQILPGNRETSDRKLQEINTELEKLEEIYTQLDKAANRYTTWMLLGGYVVLWIQFGAFYHLTWGDLSWDVMEPIAYMISLGYMLLGYTYFLVTKGQVFDLGPFKAFWLTRIMKQRALKLEFDEERYHHLRKLKERYVKHLAHAPLKQQ
ncbi:hypothetical protein Agub_g11484 [Astrephomene gubernaculifera]|uniref:Calcium uniporter protein C-terminal domain-containing protein n=1 Tax=Astrephomene gubernaculifera TaxID=47775 RepID=A0AAD3DY94_9CHLO|nr:hypothetical protein Agub_g11484 [Astrephomene gubernaculifera]